MNSSIIPESNTSMNKKVVDSESYYRKIKALNTEHYAGEIDYYVNADLRVAEEAILKKINKGSKILDLGCGSGRFSVGAAKKGFDVTGLDITQEAIVAAKERALREKLNISFICGDMTQIPFNDNEFDSVFCPRFSINAVATTEKRKQAIREMLRVAKNGSVIRIESFNNWYLGKGPILFIRNMIRDIFRKMRLNICSLLNIQYTGLLPGDITYKANKVDTASIGYAHLPSVFELRRLIPKGYKYKMYSIPQIIGKRKIDLLKFFRYSIWIFIEK